MFKRLLRPKFLIYFFVLSALLIPSIVILADMYGNYDAGFRSNSGAYGTIDMRPYGAACKNVSNNTGNNYFIPTKTVNEWNQFIAHTPTNVNLTDCIVCDSNPSGVYAAATYYTDHNCGHTPACGLTGAIANSSAGATCGLSGRWRAVQCAYLSKPSTMCNGDPCLTGIDNSSYAGPQFCYGHYSTYYHTCVYEGRTAVTVSNNVPYTFTEHAGGNGTEATWGSCATHVTCGDGICSSDYSEDCSNCSSDCGACPTDCSIYPKMTICNLYPDCWWDSSTYSCRSAYDNPNQPVS